MSNPSKSEVARFVTFLNPHPRTRSILPVELADDLWRIDLLGGVPRYPRVQRKRKREKGDTEGDTRETEGLPTEHRRYTYGTCQNSRGYGWDYVSIIYTRVDLGSS